MGVALFTSQRRPKHDSCPPSEERRSQVVPFDLADIPMFNADIEAQEDPESVGAFKRAIAHADALLIATPE